MADLVTNVIEFKGKEKDIARLFRDVKLVPDTEKEDNVFDFNGIAPMPKELLDTVSPPQIFDTQEEVDEYNKNRIEVNKKNGHPVDEKIGAITRQEEARRIGVYGHSINNGIFRPRPVIDWYGWSNKFWGTKWNAFDVKLIKRGEGLLVVQFDTAWCFPRAVIETAKEKYNIEFNAVVYGELGGRVTYENEGDEVFEVRTTHEVEYIG